MNRLATWTRCARFGREPDGTSAVEFALIVPLFLMLIFGIVDFSRALWAWNQAEKATQAGVRFAVVNNLVAGGLNFDGVPLAGGSGLPVPVAAVNNGNPIVCTSTSAGAVSCAPNGWGPVNTAAFNAIVARMQVFFAAIGPENVVIEYRHVGLGFAGNPYGPDIAPAVTVRLTGLAFNFLTPIVAGLVSIPMPAFAATLTGEDLSS
ncbi:MAG: pilus assembly protein [Alphaproteobacteria bacterium]|nr:pilus assembly protein [Alphaproteobacteria bacterium]